MWYMPPFVWVTVIWTSVTIGCLAGVVFSSPRLGRLRGPAMVFAVPGMLLLIRGVTTLRESTGLSTVAIGLVWLVTTLILSIPCAFVPMKQARFRPFWLAGAIVSAAVLVTLAANPDTKQGRVAGVPEATSQKNVALIFLDTLRYDDGVGGNQPAMPKLAAFASGATSFDNAWAPAPWTVPSHFSVLTGVDYWTLPPLEGASPGFQYQGPTLAQRFRSRGYDTAAILSNSLLGDPDFSRGYDRFTYSRASGVCRSFVGELLNRSFVHGGPRSPLCGGLIASEITSRALRFVQSASRELPGHPPSLLRSARMPRSVVPAAGARGARGVPPFYGGFAGQRVRTRARPSAVSGCDEVYGPIPGNAARRARARPEHDRRSGG
jgi:hypothetical protein